MPITDSTICLADVSRLRIFSFYGSVELAEKDLPRAKACSARWNEQADYRPMTYGEYSTAQRKSLLSDPLTEIDEKSYMAALECLPPLKWHRASDGVMLFLMSEFYTRSYTKQYAAYQRRFYTRMVDADDKTTWITVKEIDRLKAIVAQSS